MENLNLEEQLELYESSPVVAYTCRPDGDYGATFISPGISALLGWKASDSLNDPSFWASHIHPDDKERVFDELSNLFENDHHSHEYRFQHKDGSYRWLSDVLRLERDGSGEPVRIVGYWTDITGKKLSEQTLIDREQELTDSETRYRQLAELSPDGMLVHINGEIVFANASLARILAIPSPEDLLGTQAIELTAPEFRARTKRRRDKIMEGKISALAQSEFVRPDGSRVPIERTGARIVWRGNPAILVLIRDVSERKRAEDDLKDSRDQLRSVTDNLPALIAYIDAEQRYRFANKTASEWHARPVEEIIGRTASEIHGQDYEKLRSRVENALAGEQVNYTDSLTFSDGVTRITRATNVPHRGPDGKVVGFFSLVEDISELCQAENALRQSEAHLRAIADNSPSAIFLKDSDGRYIFANQVWHDMYNPTDTDINGKTVYDFLPPEIAGPMSEVDAKVLATGVPVVEEQFVPTAGRGPQNLLSTKFPVRDGDGNIVALGVVNTDITERVGAEQHMFESEAKFRAIFEQAGLGIVVIGRDGTFLDANSAMSEMLGFAVDELIGEGIGSLTVEDDLDHSMEQFNALLNRENAIACFEKRYLRKGGEPFEVNVISTAVFDPDGEFKFTVALIEDISERKKADHALQESEDALRQAQKMEAVGQLTGGVAHDFNNLLAVILGNTELLIDKIGDDQLLASIDRAAIRGSELTHRLLAFSRRQTLAPQSINLVVLVSDHRDLLQRTLGEPVKVKTGISEDIWPVLADPGQLENALLNLAINARDAMPGGGILQIRCSNIERKEGDMRNGYDVAAGDYVQIAVRDTGTGIPEEMLEHVFEPFYTTKGVGEGSGLGLSMVYGFVRQSGGDATIESEMGAGTVVRLLLPRSVVATASDEPILENARKSAVSY